MQLNTSTPASVFRRLAAFLYDCLLLIAIFFVFTAFALYLNDGNAIENIFYKLLLLPIAWSFFAWFWINGGQTLGMRAWQIKLIDSKDRKISIKTTMIRFSAGCLLFGFTLLASYFNQQRLSLHDRISGTRITRIKKI